MNMPAPNKEIKLYARIQPNHMRTFIYADPLHFNVKKYKKKFFFK